MKRLFYLIALLSVAFACQATPTIPTVGATIPSGDKNDGAPGTVFQLCKRTYKAARINDNGGLSNFEGSNYLEVYIEGKYPDECSFHGMMGGIEPKWVTPIDAEGLFFSRLFYEGQKIGCLSDGTPIYIYPAELIQNTDGGYYIGVQQQGVTFHHPSRGVSIAYFGKDFLPIDQGYPYEFYFKMSNYAFFVAKDNGDLVSVDNCIYYDTLIAPIGECTYAPASDATYIQSQILSKSMGSFSDDRFPSLQGRFVTVATEADSIYIKNLFPESGTIWLKGLLDKGKAIFRRGDVVAARGELKHLGIYDWKVAYRHNTEELVLKPVSSDLTFDYDPVTNILSNPSAAFDATTEVDLKTSYLTDELDVNKPSVYIDAEISPWHDMPLTPQKPVILYIMSQTNIFGEKPVSTFTLSDVSMTGMLMDSRRLYYRYVINEDIPIEVSLEDRDGNKYDTTDIPFNYTGSLNRNKTSILQKGNIWEINFDIDDIWQVDIQLFYKGGGEERSSEICTGVDEIVEPSPATESSAVFDLQGCQVDPDRLSPGIYVRSGRKFIKH